MKSKILSGYVFNALLATMVVSSYVPTCVAEEIEQSSSAQVIADRQEVQIYLSELELQEIFKDPTRSYVYVGREISRIADLMTELSKLDNDQESLVHRLKNHIERGFNIGNYDGVAQALEYAEQLLEKNRSSLDDEKALALTHLLNIAIQQVINEDLNLDAEKLSFLKGSVDVVEDVIRSGLRLFSIKEKMHVHGKAKFFKDVTFKDDVTIKGSLSVVTTNFTNLSVTNASITNASITDAVITNLSVLDCMDFLCVNTLSVGEQTVGSLSVGNEIIGCDLTVGCNISMTDSISADSGNIIKADAPFIHTYPGIASGNTFVGENSGNFSMTGTSNSGFGASALQFNSSGAQNTAIGNNAMVNNATGSNSVAVGWSAYSSGDYNVIVGSDAGNNGSYDTAIGYQALYSDETGSNTAVGYQAMSNVVTGSGNIAVGYDAGTALNSSESNNIYIGNVGVVAESAAIRIGTLGTQTTCFIQGINSVTTGLAAVPVLVDANGQLGITSSTRRVKHNINRMADDSEVIYQLNPVTFAYNNDSTERKQYGLIAEEVNEVFSDIVVKDEDGNPYTVQYQVLPVLLLNEMKKLAARVAALEARE
jgi:endosialidase-like protein